MGLRSLFQGLAEYWAGSGSDTDSPGGSASSAVGAVGVSPRPDAAESSDAPSTSPGPHCDKCGHLTEDRYVALRPIAGDSRFPHQLALCRPCFEQQRAEEAGGNS